MGEAASAADAAAQINKLRPDLRLLDVQMPGGSGFDLLAALDDAADGLDLHLLDGSVVEVSRRRAQQFKAATGL